MTSAVSPCEHFERVPMISLCQYQLNDVCKAMGERKYFVRKFKEHENYQEGLNSGMQNGRNGFC